MTTTTKRRWFSKRNGIIAIIFCLLLGYFCLVPSRLVISPETTLITGPLRKDGTPDYIAAYMEWNNERLRNPEDNGMRLVIAALGPQALEHRYLWEKIPWEEMPTNQESKEWYETEWLPLCAAMAIDPTKKPKEYNDFHGYLWRHWKQKKDEEWENVQELYKELSTKPWKVEDQLHAAKWLEENSAILDLFGVAARKPNWACFRHSYSQNNFIFELLLPDIQFLRVPGRDLLIRINERLSRGNVDGAWYDTMTIFRIGRHLYKEPSIVAHLVGFALEGQGFEAVQEILKYGHPDAEQLKRFAEELDNLPKRNLADIGKLPFLEKQIGFDALFHLSQPEVQDLLKNMSEYVVKSHPLLSPITVPAVRIGLLLPYDRNIAVRRLSERFVSIETAIREPNPKKRRELLNAAEPREFNESNFYGAKLMLLPLIHFRSQWIGDITYHYFSPAVNAYYSSMDRIQAQFDLLRLAIALERYQQEDIQKKYPESLDDLVPKYIDDIPLDVFTSRDTITYRRSESGYVLYSYGMDEKDGGGVIEKKNSHRPDLDIVIQR